MSDQEYKAVTNDCLQLVRMAESLGSKLNAPFMTLSFVALLVIPQIRLSDRGLFDSERLRFIDLFESGRSTRARRSVRRVVRSDSRGSSAYQMGHP